MSNTNTSGVDFISKEIENLKKKLDGTQMKLYNSIIDNLVTCCNAKAGTGKTTVATMAAFDLLQKGIVTKIYYVRFPDQLMQSLGALPGDIDEKEDYYFQPFYRKNGLCHSKTGNASRGRGNIGERTGKHHTTAVCGCGKRGQCERYV